MPIALALAALPAFIFPPITSLADPAPKHPEIEARYTAQYRQCLADPALNTISQDQCNSTEMARQDIKLNATWRLTIQRLAPPKVAELRLDERRWITARKAYCSRAAKEGEGGTIETLLYGQCMIDETIHRILWLERLGR